MNNNSKKLEITEASPSHYLVKKTGESFTFDRGTMEIDEVGRLKQVNTNHSFPIYGFLITSSAAVINVMDHTRGFIHQVETIARP